MIYFLSHIRWAPLRILVLVLAIPIVAAGAFIDALIVSPASLTDPRFYNNAARTYAAALQGKFTNK